jgi:hypothetical protein
LNAAPFFFKQEYLLTAQQGVGAFPASLANPALHRWSTGGTGGRAGDQGQAVLLRSHISMVQLRPGHGPVAVQRALGLTDDRSTAGSGECALTSWNKWEADHHHHQPHRIGNA